MNHRDVEQLSAYLDEELNPSDSARLKTRLASNPALVSALDALRESRSLLRRMPHRRAPRNFTLTRKMVGLKPPLPRSYPIFRFATVVATLLFGLSFLQLRPLTFGASAPAPVAFGGGADAATEAPAMEMALATEPLATETPFVEEAPAEPEALPTEMALSLPAPADDQNRAVQPEKAAPKTAESPLPARPLLTQWQIAFGVIALLGAASMLLIRQLAARKWK